MRRILFLILCLFIFFGSAYAQRMSDEQVVEYVKQAQAAGKSQKQMTAELLRRGVTRGDADDEIAALVDGDEHLAGTALPHGGGHFRGDLPQKSVGNDDPDGSHDQIRFPAADHHRVLPCSRFVRPGLQHGGGGGAVGAHRRNFQLRELPLHCCNHLFPDAAALCVNDKKIHLSFLQFYSAFILSENCEHFHESPGTSL